MNKYERYQQTREMINYERNAELRKIIELETMMAKYPNPSTEYTMDTVQKQEGINLDGRCVECAKGKYRFIMHPSVAEKYAGTIREVMSESPCQCGSYLWLISIPPKNNKLDDML